ncbi:MAG: 50S ribosomal protein L3 [Phycisphaerae bacterium]
MTPAILGKKIGMTRVFDDRGASVSVTVIQAGPCTVLQVKTLQSDGYEAVQLGFEEARSARATLPQIGHARKAGVRPCRFVREIRLSSPAEAKPGAVVTVEAFEQEGVAFVDVVGTTIGKGYQGVMKRWNFRGQLASHGVERKHRSPGSIGGSGDLGEGRGIKLGKRMSGRWGHERRTIQSQKLVAVDKDRHLLVIKGAIPGPKGGYVVVSRARKKA